MIESANINDVEIIEFLDIIKKLDYSLLLYDRETRRNPDSGLVQNLNKGEFPIFKFKENNKICLNNDIEILFLGFMWNTISDPFEMEKVLLPLYVSFYLEKPVYIYLKPRYFKFDYVEGITKVLDNNIIPKNFNLIVSRSDALEAYNNQPNCKSIVITPVNYYSQKCNFMYKNDFLFKHPDPFFCDVYKSNTRNDLNCILFLGTMWDYKGQYFFLQHVDSELIKDYTILLIGVERQHTFKECICMAKKKNISLICIPFIHQKLLFKIVPRCKYQISYCCNRSLDPNPRAITEGLFAGLPFLVSNYTIIPELIQNNQKIGVVCENNNAIDLNNKLKILLTLKNEDVIEFVEKKCNYNDVCKNITEHILNKYKEL
jgi:glycosyltransferase involved in cell wall biosynthesis